MLEHIIILAMGPSWGKCPKKAPEGAEIWAVNTMYRNHPGIDRLFIMHDVRKDILLQDAYFVDNVNESGLPIYTAGDYPCFTNNRPYPLQDILNEFKTGFFLNCMCYMIALAITEKPKKITLYGVDMRPDSGMEYHQNEKGAVEFWLGVAIGRGIQVIIPEESYILKRVMTGNFYGYIQRKEVSGLVTLIPENQKRLYGNYKLTPIDPKTGKEIDKGVVCNVKGWEQKGTPE